MEHGRLKLQVNKCTIVEHGTVSSSICMANLLENFSERKGKNLTSEECVEPGKLNFRRIC
jgi:hypothetical protein